jgi:Scramblase
VDNLFGFDEIRIRQPGRLLAGRASFEIFGDGKTLLATAVETEGRSTLAKITQLIPHTRALDVMNEAGEPLFALILDRSEFAADLIDSDEKLIGKIRIAGSRREYTLVGGDDEVVAKAVGDLAVKRFTVSGPGLPPFAEIRKTWAGPLKESLTSADNYTVKFTRTTITPEVRVLTVMVPVVLDLAKYGPA